MSEFVSLDGVMEGPGAMDDFEFAGWTMPYASAEIMKFKYDELFAADALLLGRVTYDGFADAWPKITEAGDFGERMNGIQKYVVSKSEQTLGWNNSKLINGSVVEEIANLKQQSGKDLLVAGSSVLVQTLLQHDLVDEYRLLVYPVVLGKGKRLFKEGSHAKLKLEEVKSFSSGVTLLRYLSNGEK
jgi:dihydrofolate reductase